MTKKEQISKFLREWNGDGYTVQNVYIEKECADLMAEGILKIFATPNFLGQIEQFCPKCKSLNIEIDYGLGELYCHDCEEIVGA